MTWAEAVDARGWTAVIIASIGLSMESPHLFTTIVTVVITMSMLRWALGRLPTSPEEEARPEREEFEAKGFVPNIERLLVAVDARPSGQFGSRLVGLLAGARRIQREIVRLRSRSVVTICGDRGKPAVRSPTVPRPARTGGMLGPLRRE
jgi:hypothetical protein